MARDRSRIGRRKARGEDITVIISSEVQNTEGTYAPRLPCLPQADAGMLRVSVFVDEFLKLWRPKVD